MWSLLREALPAETLVVAIDPGKVANRVWLATGDRGLVREPFSVPTLREGVEELERLIARSGVPGAPVINANPPSPASCSTRQLSISSTNTAANSGSYC